MSNNSLTIKIALALFVTLLISGTAYATTLISPTGDGGLETGSTFPANGWAVINGANNMWYVGNAPVVYAGSNCAFTSINSTSWTGENVANVNHFYRDVTFPTGEGAVQLKFWYKVVNVDATFDYLRVYVIPTSTTPVVGTLLASGQIGTNYETATTWTEVTLNFAVTPGTTQRLVFSWRSDGAAPAGAVAVDNISLISWALVPLVGGNTYPINGVDNPPVSFASITSAATYLSGNGVTGTGQVMLELNTGYTGEPAYPVTFGAIAGVSSTLGVTIRPAPGTSAFTLEGSGTAIFYLSGVNYLTIDGRPGGTGTASNIIVSNTSTSAPAILLINGASYNTIKYCIVKGVNTTTGGVFYISAGSSNRNNLIENCEITKGATSPAYGFYFYGVSTSYNKFNTISKCKVYDFSSSGFYFYWYDTTTTIQDCEIYTLTQQTTSTLYGINITAASATYGTKMLRNKIYGFWTSAASPTFYGIYIATASATIPHTIVNNMIAFDATVTNPGATIYGIYESFSTVGTLYDIYYNSIYIGGTGVTGGSSYGIQRYYQSNSNFENNIIFNNRVNSTGTGKHYCYYATNTGAGLVSNNNDFYAPNANGYVGYWTADRQTLADWKTASNQDLNSVSQNPNYVNVTASPPDLHINTAIATRLESGGLPIAGITTDIDGDTRAGSSKIHNNVQPDIGADEFNGIALDEMPPAITYTPLANTPYTTNRTLTAVITDYVSGLANDPARAPRLYYKKNTAGTWAIDTVMTSTGNNWTFTFNHTRVGGVVTNDTIFYYVQATDSSNNTGTNPFGGASAPNSYRILPSMAGNYNIGTGQTYTTLKSFFNALNGSAITGNVTGTITSDITETVPDTLYQLSYFGGTWQIRIVPALAKPVFTISGAIAGPLIYLNGADNVTFDGMGKNLVFRNTSTSGQVFVFINDATIDTIKSCVIEGCGSSTSYPTIYIYTSTGTLGNSYNAITGNDIRDLSTTGARQYVAIYSSGTSTAPNRFNTISNNNIFNFSYYGIYLGNTGNGANWTISGNSFYYNNVTALSTGHYAIYFYPGTAANSNMIYGNFIGGQAPNCGGGAYTTSSSFYGIYAYSFGTSAKSYIRKNTIKNITLTNTGAYGFYGIYVYTGIADIDSNTIGDPSLAARDLVVPSYSNNISLSNTTTLRKERIEKADNGMTLDMDVLDQTEPDFVTSASASKVIKPDFTENSISNAGTSVTYGIYSYTAYPIKIEANQVSNMTANGTGTGVACRGIVVSAAATCTAYVNSNVVHHIKSAGTSTSLGGTATGVYYWPSAFCPVGQFYNNTAYTIIATNNTAVQNNAVGLIVNNTQIPAYNNKAYDIRNASTGTTATTPPTAVGMVVGATSYPAVYNNMISVGDGQTTNTEFIGIWNYFGTNNGYGLYNNSVWVMGTCADGALPSFGYLRGNNTGTAVVTRTDGKDNIFLNTRTGGTGKHYAIANQATLVDSFGWWFDYNVLKTSNPATLGLWGTTDLSFTNWKLTHPAGSGGDAHSISADPGYMGVTDLHINPTSLVPNRKAIPIVGITTDFDMQTRNAMYPDIGADEYTPSPPQEFTLISPVNGAITQPLTGQLVWGKSLRAEFYDVYLDDVNPPVTKVSTLQTETTYTYSGIMPNLTYYWKVAAQNDTGVVEGSTSSAIWSFETEIWDAGATAIIKPSAIGFAGNIIIPKVKVKNFGSGMIPSFPVTMNIGSVYTNTKTVNNLMAGDSLIVNFDPWTAVLGTYNLLAYTGLELDNNFANDTVRGSVEIQPPAHNVGTMEIIAPIDTIVEGTVVTPRAMIKNFGAYTENFIVRFKIGEVYNQTATIENFESNAETTISLPNWTATRCNYVVSCSTELAIDQLPEDDKITEMVTVKYNDVGVVAILAPRDTVITCNDYTPMVVISNNGVHTYPALCSVMVKIMRYPAQMESSYCNIGPVPTADVIYESWMVAELSMDEVDTFYFPEWHPYWWDIYWTLDPTYHIVIAEVKMAADMNSENDMLEEELIAKGRSNDLQMNWTGLLNSYTPMHAETLGVGTYNVASVVSNSPMGPSAKFRAKVKIIRENTNSIVYSKYEDQTLIAQSYTCIAFQTGWSPSDTGWYLVRSWLETRDGVDVVPQNNSWEKHYYFINSGPSEEGIVKTNDPIQNAGSASVPTTFGLMANRPNPFMTHTAIQWQIPVSSNVVISIYDATGRIVKTIVNGSYTPGYYNVTWDRSDENHNKVASGIYFFEMRTDKYSARHKMVITN